MILYFENKIYPLPAPRLRGQEAGVRGILSIKH